VHPFTLGAFFEADVIDLIRARIAHRSMRALLISRLTRTLGPSWGTRIARLRVIGRIAMRWESSLRNGA